MIGREDRDNNQSGGVSDNMQDDSSSFDSSNDDEEDDISEIIDLQKALEYLVSERDIEIYKGIISTSQPTNTCKVESREECK